MVKVTKFEHLITRGIYPHTQIPLIPDSFVMSISYKFGHLLSHDQ